MRMGMGLLIVLSLLLSGIMLAPPADSGDVEITINTPLVSHAPIRIDSDADFPGIATAGDGSVGTPWVIENWEIDGTGNASCVYVGNTTQHFIIRNNSLHDVSLSVDWYWEPGAGLNLYNVTNGTVNNITSYSNIEQGIYLVESNNCTINYSASYSNVKNGFLLRNSRNITLDNNSAYNNNQGIYLITNSTNNTLTYNNANLYLDSGCDNNTIRNNTASNTVTRAIGIEHSDDNVVLYNNCSNAFDGIFLTYANNTDIRQNTVANNSQVGIILYNSENNTIVNNSVENNIVGGISLSSSLNNIIYHNDVYNNTVQASDDNVNNVWDNGYPSGGNYWSDYSGDDFYMDINQDVWGKDGVGDSPYSVGGGNVDDFPLMYPYESFITAEFIPPLALDQSPNGTEILKNALIQITWNETMNWTSVEGAFNYTDGVTNYSSADGVWLHDDNTNISTFTPATDFDYEAQYFVTVNITATDIIGNPLDQDGNGTGGYWPVDVLVWNFTIDDEIPFVISTSPANAQVDVDPNSPIIMTFSEPMNQSAVEDSFSYTNGTMNWTIANGTEYWNIDSTVFTFSPMPALERNQTFTVSLNGSMARDAGGHIIGSNYTWTFKTWLEPPPPHVIDTYPPSGAIIVPVNTYINLAFDVEMDIMTVQDAFSYTDGNGTWDVSNGSVDWYSGNKLFSFQPDERLNFDSTYTVVLGTNASSVYAKTLDGNNNGVSDPIDGFVFTFTTSLEPPSIESHYPALDQVEIPTMLSAIYINFSQPMDMTSVTNGVSIYPNTDYMPSFSANQKELTLVLNEELLGASPYRVTVMNTAQDIAGTKLDGNGDGASGDKFTFVFITEGAVLLEHPQIVSIFPSNNETIPVEELYISVTFSQQMNRTSVQEAFSFRNETSDINGTFAWSTTGKSIRFTPEASLEFNTTYFVTMAGTARNTEGLMLGNTSSWQYISESEEVPASFGDLLLYGAIIVLLVLTVMLYMANRSLRMDLRKNRVMLKRALKRSGLKEEDLKTKQKPDKAETPKPDADVPEIEEPPEEIVPEEEVPVEAEQVEPEKVDRLDE